MLMFFLIPFLLLISFLWALYSLKRALRKQEERAEKMHSKKINGELKHGEEVVLFELKD